MSHFIVYLLLEINNKSTDRKELEQNNNNFKRICSTISDTQQKIRKDAFNFFPPIDFNFPINSNLIKVSNQMNNNFQLKHRSLIGTVN